MQKFSFRPILNQFRLTGRFWLPYIYVLCYEGGNIVQDLILDCYTDEPSGLGVPPFLGVHQRYLAGALKLSGSAVSYLTIDDIRYSSGEPLDSNRTTNVRTRNASINRNEALKLLAEARRIFVVMGCFVPYEYLSCEPPTISEIVDVLKPLRGRKVLIFVLGGPQMPSQSINGIFDNVFDEIVTGHAYNYVLGGFTDSLAPEYRLLRDVSVLGSDLVLQSFSPIMAEIETAIGCERKPGCNFCIENLRGVPHQSRPVEDIILEVRKLYSLGVRHFRLGRQPNFYYYQNASPAEIEKLLYGIRSGCPDLRTLHIDNVNPETVATQAGREITAHIAKYCTSGNIASFGIESFDPEVRAKNNLNGSIDTIMEAIAILNRYGANRDADGNCRFLPGINLIYGLSGQSEKTLEQNLRGLQAIIQQGHLVRRLFLRPLTSPNGRDLEGTTMTEEQRADLKHWTQHIEDEFEVPMLQRVFPVGTLLTAQRAEVWKNGSTICRQIATCPVRVKVFDKQVPLDTFVNVVVDGYEERRTVRGVLHAW